MDTDLETNMDLETDTDLETDPYPFPEIVNWTHYQNCIWNGFEN
jgi:hypothetical protein